jgi:hypothetical protein
MPRQKLIAPAPAIENKIRLVRGQKVMLDSDLAELYEVPTKRLNEVVRRNLDRFPEDCVSSNERRGGKLEIPDWNVKLGR